MIESSSLTFLIIVIIIALAFEFANGFNDAANAIATVVSTRVMSPLSAVIMAAVFNFSGSTRTDYRIGLPQTGVWREVLNTDAPHYSGSGEGNMGSVTATAESWHGRPASARMTLPANGAVWIVPEG